MVHDRFDSRDIPLTQELIANMIGTRRSTVSPSWQASFSPVG
jgi:hypothetical protein